MQTYLSSFKFTKLALGGEHQYLIQYFTAPDFISGLHCSVKLFQIIPLVCALHNWNPLKMFSNDSSESGHLESRLYFSFA